MTSFSKKTTRAQHNSRINLITFGIIAIVIGISSVWWYQNQNQDTLTPSKSPKTTTAAVAQQPKEQSPTDGVKDDDFTTINELAKPSLEPVDNEEKNIRQIASKSSDSSQSSASSRKAASQEQSLETVAATPEAVPEDKTSVQPASSKLSTVPTSTKQPSSKSSVSDSTDSSATAFTALTMNFSDDCWVRVTDASGTTLLVGLKKANQTVHLQGEAPFSVVLGAPESVSITFAGEPVDLSRYTSGKVARLTLP